MLSPDELGLFREQIRFIDKKIQPGLTKLMWTVKGTSNAFIRDCLLHVDKVGSHAFITLLCGRACAVVQWVLVGKMDEWRVVGLNQLT